MRVDILMGAVLPVSLRGKSILAHFGSNDKNESGISVVQDGMASSYADLNMEGTCTLALFEL